MIFDRLQEKREVSVNNWKDIYSFENGYDITPFDLEMKESTYYSCIKIISESVAKCGLQIKQETEKGEIVGRKHYLYDKLRLRPNEYMSSIDCYKTLVSLSKHYGIAGLYIDRSISGKIDGLYPVKITDITIDDLGIIKSTKENKILYSFVVAGTSSEQNCLDKDLIILRDFSLNGIETKANKSVMRESLDSSIKSQNYLNKLFSNGLTNKIAIQLTSMVKDEKELAKIQEKFDRMYSTNGKIFTLPAGFQAQPLNLTLADACYPELRRMSKEEIAMSFNVPPSKLGWTKDNAKSEEQDNIQFLQDCLQVIFQAIEQEMDWKLLTDRERRQGYKIRFNTNVMLRVDAKTQAEIISTYIQNGAYDLDLARDLLGVERIGGDKIVTLPSGQVLLSDLLNGNVSYQKGGGKDDNTRTD